MNSDFQTNFLKKGMNMKLMNKILSKSNSFNYYKSNYEKLKEEKRQLEKKNKQLSNEKKAKQRQITEKNKEITRLYYYAPKDIGRKWYYKRRMGKELNLDSPKDINEKINWLIVNEIGEDEGKLTDKYLVKDFVENKNIEDLFIPKTYRIYKNAEDINIDELPEKFVLKCNHGSGLVFICTDKENFDIENAKTKLADNLKENYAFRGLEYHYSFIEPVIMAEEYLDDHHHIMPIDYKFYSFNGNVKSILLCSNRENKLEKYGFNLDWKLLYSIGDNNKCDIILEKPKNLERMIKIAEELSKDFTLVRVDLYNIDEKIYFGELTFTPANGCINYLDQETLDYLGSMLSLPCDR